MQRCVDAARENIRLIRDCLATYPQLRNWTHLYYYMLSSALVFIDRLNQAPFDQRALDYTRCCDLATDVFDWMRPLGGTGIDFRLDSANPTDKIVAIIKNCLDEWRKRRASRVTDPTKSVTKQPDIEIQAPQSDVSSPEASDHSRSQSRDPGEYTRASRHHFPPETNHNRRPSSEIDSVFVSPRAPMTARTDYPPYVHHPENIAPSFLNGSTQFLPDIYLASNALAFNPGNTIAIMPTSPYDSFGALLNSEMGPSVHQSTSRVSNGARVERQDEEEQVTGYTFNPSERIERMFGISPPWRER